MRWKVVIPLAVVVSLIVVFNVFFLDPLLKRGLVKTGEMIFGARVEIDSLRTKLRNLSVSIKGLRVANKNDPWKNLFEVSEIKFALKPIPLLSKKFIIEEMSIEGIITDTPRKTSGLLPPKRIAKIEKRKKKEGLVSKFYERLKTAAKSEIAALPALSTIKSYEKELKDISVDRVIKLDELETLKGLTAIREDYTQKFSHYELKLGELKLNERFKRFENTIQLASKVEIKDIKDIENTKGVINELNRSREELEKTHLEIKQLTDKISYDFGSQKDLLNRIDELKEKDYRALAEKIKLPSITFGNISEALFGRVWIERVNSVIYYINLARKYMPSRKKDEKIIKKRLKGRDISFPRKDLPPDFLIKKISLSGSISGSEPLNFSGEATNITSDPVLIGQPTIIEIKGSKGNRTLFFLANFDHTQPIPHNSIKISYSGFKTTSLKIPSSEYLPSFEKSISKLSGEFVMKGDLLDCGINLAMDNISTPDTRDDEVGRVIKSLWTGINNIFVEAKISGTTEDFKISVTSNIEKIFSERLRVLLGEKIAEIQKKIKTEIDRLTNETKNEVLKEFNFKKETTQKQYTDKQDEVLAKIEHIKAKSKELENLIKEHTEKEKRKAEEELKKTIPQKLPDIFRK